MATETDPNSFQDRFPAIQQIPPLSPVARELLAQIERDDSDIPRLAALIEQDPALTARLLGVANSAYFGRQEKVWTVAEAIIRVLGLKLVKSIALGIALAAPFDASRCRSFELDRHWYRSMLTAALAGRLAAQAGLNGDAGSLLYAAGLLHNLGQLALVHLFPAEMDQAFREHRRHPEQDLRGLERRLLGVDECQAGMALGYRWHLPGTLIRIIEHAYAAEYRGEDWRAARLVGYCSALADACFRDPEHCRETLPLREASLPGLDGEAVEKALDALSGLDAETRLLARQMAGH